MSKWIPVSERLPEEGKNVLVTVHFIGADKNDEGWYVTAEPYDYVDVAEMLFDNDTNSWSSLSDEYKMDKSKYKVVAWMPLPEPYKGE